MIRDHKPESDQLNIPRNESKARKNIERIGISLRRDSPQLLTDGTDQNIPYAEIFRKNYDNIPTDLRSKARAIEQGNIIEVSVADLPNPEGVLEPQDFNHHMTYEDAKLHTQQLNEVVLPWVRTGAVGDDFKSLDQTLGQVHEVGTNSNGYYETYRLFYGNEPITVDSTADGGLDIIDGRHRIYMAKTLGLVTLPVRRAG